MLHSWNTGRSPRTPCRLRAGVVKAQLLAITVRTRNGVALGRRPIWMPRQHACNFLSWYDWVDFLASFFRRSSLRRGHQQCRGPFRRACSAPRSRKISGNRPSRGSAAGRLLRPCRVLPERRARITDPPITDLSKREVRYHRTRLIFDPNVGIVQAYLVETARSVDDRRDRCARPSHRVRPEIDFSRSLKHRIDCCHHLVSFHRDLDRRIGTSNARGGIQYASDKRKYRDHRSGQQRNRNQALKQRESLLISIV